MGKGLSKLIALCSLLFCIALNIIRLASFALSLQMAQNKLISCIFLLLVLSFCQEIQSFEGRNMKLERANELTQEPQNSHKILKNEEAKNINLHANTGDGEVFPSPRHFPFGGCP
ncbi:hypothetical protein OWV82_010393 [Melia azedarach]|uniref:Uncharacterized protein n=1 Tax=Melia azedarach TaxID=155640 RepID=A0ACC1Y4Z4_MELAZ|nr:hypothetical protein OWV82_010393 [Melia azedarach]